MENVDLQLWRWTGILLVTGGIIFWIGACTPPYKWWMTRDVKEYLALIYENKHTWYFIAATFAIGVIITLFGMLLFSIALQQSGEKVFPRIGFFAFMFGCSFWILNIAFRATVTVWAAQQLHDVNLLEPSFHPWMDWTNLIFAIYMVVAYFGIGCMGYSLHQLSILPSWTSWMCMIFGFGGSVLYLCRFPFFEPPLMVHTPLIITGIVILLKLKT
jgi:hypothetical protein